LFPLNLAVLDHVARPLVLELCQLAYRAIKTVRRLAERVTVLPEIGNPFAGLAFSRGFSSSLRMMAGMSSPWKCTNLRPSLW
jgi:hypothetical protein